MQTPVQVTVVEYVAEFFRQYKSRAYGRSISVNAKGGADALMGMLKLVLSKGGREELRIALHCFKDQLALALNSGHSRHQQLEELFALLSSLIDAAERLRQFSPVKESFSSAVLEEVRWRLFRIVAGDGFSEAAGIRRRALDIIFQSMQREQQEQQKSLARQQQLAATAGGGTSSRSSSSDLANVSPSKVRLRGSFQRKVAGPDVSSWEGLWHSLAAMSGKRMLPLLQSVLLDLYSGKHMPGSPAAAAAALSKASITPQKQQQQQQPLQQQANGCSSMNPAPSAAAAAAVTVPAPSRSDTAINFDVTAAAAASGSCSGSPRCASALPDNFSKPVACAVYANSNDVCSANPISSCGVDTPPRQHSDGHEAATADQLQHGSVCDECCGSEDAQLSSTDCGLNARAIAAAAAAGRGGEGDHDLRAMTEALQQQHSPIRISCGDSSSTATEGHGASPAGAAAAAMQDDSSQPDSPTSTAASSSCLGSPTAAAKRGGAGLVAKIRASVGGSSSSGSIGGPGGWVPKGWVQFHNRGKSGGGAPAAAAGTDADSSDSGAGACAQYNLADVAHHRVSGDAGSDEQQQQRQHEAQEWSRAAAAASFAGEDVEWSSSSAGRATASPAAVNV